MALEIAVIRRNDQTGEVQEILFWEDVRDVLAEEVGKFKVPRRIIGRKVDLAPIAEESVNRAVERLKQQANTV
jgi:hypothetical protein